MISRLREQTGRVVNFLIRPLVALVVRPTSVRVRVLVINDQREVLLVRSWISHQLWSPPGGGIGWGEDPKVAAVREVREETGVHIFVSDLKELGLFQRPPGEPRCILRGYQAHSNGTIKIPGWWHRAEIMEAAWFPLDQLPKRRVETVDQMLKVV